MLRAVHSNRVEALLEALLEALPPADPFAPAMIVTGSRLIAKWLTREIAFARGIASGLELVNFNQFVERVWAGDADARRAGLAALDRSRLGAALASVLDNDELVRGLPQVAAYLDAAPAPGDRAGPRRVQLADHLASLTWSYALSRPDWLPALVVGQVPHELAADPSARWQARLIGAALAVISTEQRFALTPMMPWLRRRAGLPAPKLDAPISVFGMSFVARAQLEALTDLAATTDVTVYILDPCEELWDDVAGRKTLAAPTGDPLPLVMWGKPVRDTIASLVERTHGDVEARFETRAPRNAREQMLDDVRARRSPERAATDDANVRSRIASARPRRTETNSEYAECAEVAEGEIVSTPPNRPSENSASSDQQADGCSAPIEKPGFFPAGVTVLACPNARREIEVIATEVRRLLDEDPALSAHEIGVWIAGDASISHDGTLAQAPSAFDAVSVPCHLIDAPVDDRGRIGEAVLALLELPTSAMARRDLLRVMTHPAVLAGHPHADAADWVRWTERLGIAHGADVHAHANTYLADVDPKSGGHFHWDQGVRRLALGAFMVGERGERGPARIGGMLVAPEELRPDQQASAATYALLVRSLCADAAWLAAHEAPLARWADILTALVDDYLAPRDEEATRDLERARSLIASLAKLDVGDRQVGFREAREHVTRLFAAARANRGEPLASGVMIAPLAAMRAVPFRAVFVAGLNEGAFPAGDQPSPLDLRREARVGDVSPRDRDRAAFLDVLLCTRDALYLSYVAVEPKSGQPLGPSSVVLELADALAPYLGAASSREALASITRRFPLHRHHSATLESREVWASGVRDALRAHLRAGGHPIPDEDGQLALLAHPSQAALRVALAVEGRDPVPPAPANIASRPLAIANLRDFLEYPIQAWAQAALGLGELPDIEAAEQSDEPFHLARPKRAGMLREVFAAHLCQRADRRANTLGVCDGQRSLGSIYDDAVADAQLRGQFPVGVFAEAARTLDLGILETWRAGLGPLAGATFARFGFGRAFAPGAELLPAITIELSGHRTIRLVGQTELLARVDDRFVSIVPVLRKLEKRTAYHLRGAFDHLVLAAAGLANAGHVHRLVDPQGHACEIHHEPWSPSDARAYLAALASELLDQSHGYLLPFEVLARALTNKPSISLARTFGDPTGGLGYGPIQRKDGLAMPSDAVAIAQRRLRPLVERMRGDHGFEIGRCSQPSSSRSPPVAPSSSGAPTRESRPQLTILKGGRP